MNNKSVLSLFNSFTNSCCRLTVENTEDFSFAIGKVPCPELTDNVEFAYTVNENGIHLTARNYSALMRGYFALLMKIEWDCEQTGLYIKSCQCHSNYSVENRMIHLCVFPEDTLLQIKRRIRLACSLQFTHVVLEFWGTLKLNSLPQLSWENGFSKEDIDSILCEARELGIEPIPMLNSLGHASMCRFNSGKHVVLDQDPSLFYLFTPDGWAWNLENEATWTTLKKIRLELYELFQGCKYFHCGFDESHIHNSDPYLSKRLPYYMSRMTDEIEKEGKSPIIWVDMLLPKEAYVGVNPNAHSLKSHEECMKIINGLAKSTVFVDWEYDVKSAPVNTLVYYKESGYRIMGAPWLNMENSIAHIDTIVENGLFGLMQTTWHTMAKDIDKLIPTSLHFGATLFPWQDKCPFSTVTATLLRKLSFEKTDYGSAGWVKNQI